MPPTGGGFAPKPPASGGWRLRPQTPTTAPPLRISGYAPAYFLAFRKISLERTSNNLAWALQCFLLLFCARFALLKTGFSNRNLTKKLLKLSHFCKKRKNFLRLKSQILTPHPCPPAFENFSLNTLNSEEKPSVKKTVNRR